MDSPNDAVWMRGYSLCFFPFDVERSASYCSLNFLSLSVDHLYIVYLYFLESSLSLSLSLSTTCILYLYFLESCFNYCMLYTAGPRSAVGRAPRKSEVLGSIPGLATYIRFPLRTNRRKYVHEVLVNRLGGLSLPRNSVVRLTGRPDMTLDVYRGRKTTTQQQHQQQQYVVQMIYSLIILFKNGIALFIIM